MGTLRAQDQDVRGRLAPAAAKTVESVEGNSISQFPSCRRVFLRHLSCPLNFLRMLLANVGMSPKNRNDVFQTLLRRIHPLVSGGECRPNQQQRVERSRMCRDQRSKAITYLEDSKGTSLSTLTVVSVVSVSEIFKT